MKETTKQFVIPLSIIDNFGTCHDILKFDVTLTTNQYGDYIGHSYNNGVISSDNIDDALTSLILDSTYGKFTNFILHSKLKLIPLSRLSAMLLQALMPKR